MISCLAGLLYLIVFDLADIKRHDILVYLTRSVTLPKAADGCEDLQKIVGWHVERRDLHA